MYIPRGSHQVDQKQKPTKKLGRLKQLHVEYFTSTPLKPRYGSTHSALCVGDYWRHKNVETSL